MKSGQKYYIDTIAAYHELMQLPKPGHPLVSVLKFEDIVLKPNEGWYSIVHNFYTVALKKEVDGRLTYGQQPFDFDAGILHFMSPRQVLTFQATAQPLRHTGWLLLIHPDFLWSTPLAKKINEHEFFSYETTEALHLSGKEEQLITTILQHIVQEYHAGIDAYSQDVMVAQIALLLTYAERFYNRQFVTRKIANHRMLQQLEAWMAAYFENDLATKGIPTIQAIAGALHVSPNYLSRLLKTLTGHSTQQLLHEKLIQAAKEKLSASCLSVSEIAYELGFEHPKSFSKLFKSKTNQSPMQFRNAFN